MYFMYYYYVLFIVATCSTLSSHAVSYDAMMQVANLFKDVHEKMEESLDKLEKREMRLLLVRAFPMIHRQLCRCLKFVSNSRHAISPQHAGAIKIYQARMLDSYLQTRM